MVIEEFFLSCRISELITHVVLVLCVEYMLYLTTLIALPY